MASRWLRQLWVSYMDPGYPASVQVSNTHKLHDQIVSICNWYNSNEIRYGVFVMYQKHYGRQQQTSMWWVKELEAITSESHIDWYHEMRAAIHSTALGNQQKVVIQNLLIPDNSSTLCLPWLEKYQPLLLHNIMELQSTWQYEGGTEQRAWIKPTSIELGVYLLMKWPGFVDGWVSESDYVVEAWGMWVTPMTFIAFEFETVIPIPCWLEQMDDVEYLAVAHQLNGRQNKYRAPRSIKVYHGCQQYMLNVELLDQHEKNKDAAAMQVDDAVDAQQQRLSDVAYLVRQYM